MILHRPKRAQREKDEAEYGEWVFCVWRRLGEHLVIWNWMRRHVARNDEGYRVIWRRPDNVIVSDEKLQSHGWA